MTHRAMWWPLMVVLLCISQIAFAADTLESRQRLYSNQYLASDNGKYRFYLQGDGNLVLRDWTTRKSLWSSGTHGDSGTKLSMQSDGNLVLYTASGRSVWSSKTHRTAAQRLVLHNDGNLTLQTSSGSTLWSTNTGNGNSSNNPDNDDSDSEPNDNSANIQHVGTTQVWDSNGQGLRINRPSGTRSGDLMILALHRTDDHLPFEVSGWTRAAECYKEDNGYQCLTVDDCSSRSGSFCNRFNGKYRGRDLAQVIFYRTAGSSEPSSYTFNLNQDSSGHPGWAILSTVRGADTRNPVRDWAHRGCDKNADSLFPSVSGRRGDLLLLSQSYDDAISKSRFNAPSGMDTWGYVSNSDEAGFLYGAILTRDGETGERKTQGAGASSCKDGLVALTIRAK